MKQLIVTLLFVFVYVCLFASWVPFRAGDNQLHLNVTKSDNAGVSFTIAINGMDSEEVVHNGVTYQRIEIPENSGFGAVGSPAIPRIIKLVAIPECQDVTLSVSVNTPTVLSNYNLYPNPQLVINTDANGAKYSSEVFYKDQATYEGHEYLYDYIATIKSTGYFRDQKFAEIEILPINYNPGDRTILANNELTITLSFVSPSGNINVNTGIFNGVASSTMINYPAIWNHCFGK